MDNTILATLKQRVVTNNLPGDVVDKLQNELNRIDLLIKSNNLSLETDRLISYVDFVCSLPWAKENQDILDLHRAKEILDKNHFGLESVKDKILEYLSVLILNQRQHIKTHSTTLGFVGLVGSGKTSLAYSIAESLGRPIVRIPFGGIGSAIQLRGESRIKPEAEPSLIIKAIKKAGAKNPVILLDELDRITQEARNDIMGVLVELLDPEQNMAFLDHYLEIPFDLSQVLFIATANNTNNIATAVLDRLELVEMPFYSDSQKITIAQNYLLPKALQEATIQASLVNIDPTLWLEIVRPLGFDGGIRSLKRTIEVLVRKIARKIVEGNPGPFVINGQNVGEFISK